MNTEELQEWHAVRAGWVCKCRAHYGKDMYHEERWEHPQGTWQTELMPGDHPFPATIDGAASAMPPGWKLFALEEGGPISGWSSSAVRHEGPMRQVFSHGQDEVTTRYLLAKLAWEAMGPTK